MLQRVYHLRETTVGFMASAKDRNLLRLKVILARVKLFGGTAAQPAMGASLKPVYYGFKYEQRFVKKYAVFGRGNQRQPQIQR
jgi:hypothetical protein